MRVPRHLNYRIQKQKLLRFGVYEKVYPCETTPPLNVPEHIIKPPYVHGTMPKVLKSPEIKDEQQVKGMRASCQLAANILKSVQEVVKVGVTTIDIDAHVHNSSIEAGAYPSPLNYRGFPKSCCTSVNNVVVHGIPDLRPLQDGDIVNVDITVYYKGYHGDCSNTFAVGRVDERGLELIQVANECLNLAINKCGPNVPFSIIGKTIHNHAKRKGFTVIPSCIGHGIGTYFHGPPDIYHTGLMKPGMTFTIEPVLSHGKECVTQLKDGWTVVTDDGARTAQAEHTVLINSNGVEILTT